MKKTQRATLASHLVELQQLLQTMGFWDAAPPDDESLSSSTPFCYDTLTLPQWLQWIFIPRISALLEGQHALPPSCDITDYATHWMQHQTLLDLKGKPITELVSLLQTIDRQVTLIAGSEGP